MILFIESASALSSISFYHWYGLSAFDTLSSETGQLCFAAFTNFSATPKGSSAMLKDSSADPKADIVTVEEVIAELAAFVAASADFIADQQGLIAASIYAIVTV